jgi:hypothetical protein
LSLEGRRMGPSIGQILSNRRVEAKPPPPEHRMRK